MKEGEKTLDLTYYLNYAMPYLVKEEELLRDEINNQLKIDEDNYNAYIANKPSENNDVIVDDIISDNQALPQFPQSNVENIDELVRKLREVYPDLKKKEAHFYASHCTVGLNYTIEQFKVYENSVYETARYSMDHLAMKGFYRKFKLGNKFVYTPLPRNEDK
jgi:hypothetical protein